MSHTALNLKGILRGAFSHKIPLWPKEYSTGFKAGLFLASAHLLLFVWNTLYMVWHDEGRWHIYWILCGYIDFPVSLLLTEVILPVLFRNPFNDPFMSTTIQTLMIFTMFYSFVGTAWYFWLPILIEKAGRKIATTRLTFWAVAVLIFLPIFAHWFQLLRFAGGNSQCFVPGLYSVLPAVWTFLFAVLFFATKWRKTVLWLLLLAPFIYFYCVRDLYYYITLLRH
ncbi:MAG: hypothetical protein JW749_02490 [Sedimentisphaerales bacterium]|nr:hypothetical protein [Sedimentisphaerales bacterium]